MCLLCPTPGDELSAFASANLLIQEDGSFSSFLKWPCFFLTFMLNVKKLGKIKKKKKLFLELFISIDTLWPSIMIFFLPSSISKKIVPFVLKFEKVISILLGPHMSWFVSFHVDSSQDFWCLAINCVLLFFTDIFESFKELDKWGQDWEV